MADTETRARRPGRAAPMAPDQRRQAIVEAVLPLLLEHGRAVTTKQIAEQAGIAEGTIFRVFTTKDELVDAALAQAFAPGPFLRGVEGIDHDQPLRGRLLDVVTLLQNRFLEIFALMRAVGLVAPPEHLDHKNEHGTWRARVDALLVDLVAPDVDRLRVSPSELMHYVRLLTFAGSHAEVADHKLLTPDQIVDLVLDGTLVREDDRDDYRGNPRTHSKRKS